LSAIVGAFSINQTINQKMYQILIFSDVDGLEQQVRDRIQLSHELIDRYTVSRAHDLTEFEKALPLAHIVLGV
jgi:hypothetical protein